MARKSVGMSTVNKLRDQLASAQRRSVAVRRKAGEITINLVRTAEIGTVAFVFGFIKGKKGGIDIAGVPMELAVGLGSHILGVMGVGGKAETHFRAIGDGALASYLTDYGRMMGREKKAEEGTESTEGYLNVGQGYNVGGPGGSMPKGYGRQGDQPSGGPAESKDLTDYLTLEELSALSNAL